jgi:hypothetical protein
MNIRAATGALAAALLLLSGGEAYAQRIPRSFEQLQVLVKAGDSITVATATGEELAGRIVTLTATELVIMTGSGPRSFQAGDLLRIRQRRGDSLANGIWTGVGIGVGLAVLGAASDDSDFFGAGFWIFAGGAYAAMGAGIGAGVDALIRRTYVIYDSTPIPGSSISVAPLVGTRRIGAAVAWRF